MRVNSKCSLLFACILISLSVLYGCTSTNSSSISGSLTVVTVGSRSDPGESVESVSIRGIQRVLLDVPSLSGSKGEEHAFVPDEIIVKYRPGFDQFASVKGITSSAYFEIRNDRDIAGGATSLLKLDPAGANGLSSSALMKRTLEEIAYLRSLSYVEYAEPNYIFRAHFVPSDEYYDLQWHYPLINLDRVWEDIDLMSGVLDDLSSITVAVIDTGIARKYGEDHPDLYGIFTNEYDFISKSEYSGDGDGIDGDATDERGLNTGYHGTHVAGIVGALTNNVTGVAGVAGKTAKQGVRIMPLRVLGKDGFGTVADIAEAVKYAAGISQASIASPTRKADIINMSLGGSADSSTLKAAVQAAADAGVLIVASAGNSGSGAPLYPAAYDEVISVSAVNPGADRAYYSNFGDAVLKSKIDFAAPGGDMTVDLNFDSYSDGVLSTLFNESSDVFAYAFLQGTSMAAPHVAGAAALVKKALMGAAKPSSPSDIRAVLEQNAIDLGVFGPDDEYGRGLVNAYASVQAAAGIEKAPDLFPFPALLKLEGENPEATFVLKNITGSSTISGITIAKEHFSQWLSVSPDSGAAGPELSVTVKIDTDADPSLKEPDESGLFETHIEMLTITSDAGTEHVYVMYRYDGFPQSSSKDIGIVYVVAIEVFTGQVVSVDTVTYRDFYRYTIDHLSAGMYFVGASTDRNSNGVLFEAEDAYGYYRDLNNRTVLFLGENQWLSGIDFDLIDIEEVQ
jgi:serine protease